MTGLGLELTQRQRTLLSALYPVLLLFILNPVMELVANSWPLNFGDTRWRFGFLGAILSALLPILVGLALVALVSSMLGHRGVIRAVAIAGLLVTATLIGAGLLFGLDALQVRGMVRINTRDLFDATTFKTLLMTALLVPVTGWLAIKSWEVSRGGKTADREPKAGLVVGQ